MSWVHTLLGLCNHKWKTFERINHTLDGSYYYTEFRQECIHCGKIKSVKLNKPFI
jgi:hypothetical protein